jgi:phosphoribosylanthranilate isomerase
LENPLWCSDILARFPDKIAIGLDVRGDRLATRGWTAEGGDLMETIDRLSQAGCQRFVVTDVESDGMMSGPNTDLLRRVCANTDAAVTASGGIATLDDVWALTSLTDVGVDSAIIGTALYVHSFTLGEALEIARKG